MCYFKVNAFQMFPEEPKMPADYWQPGETDQQHRARMRSERKKRAQENAEKNSAQRGTRYTSTAHNQRISSERR
jgi:hypothetical protein